MAASQDYAARRAICAGPAFAPIAIAMTERCDIAIIGAGAVGLACALHLQRDGRDVTVIDRAGPGEGASCGNAGNIATELVEPLSSLATLGQAPQLLLSRDGPLAIPLATLPGRARWLAGFLAAARPAQFRRGCHALTALQSRALAAIQRLAERTRAADLVHARGSLRVFETETGAAAAHREAARLRGLGVAVRILDRDAARRECPALPEAAEGALVFDGAGHVEDPLELCRRWAAALEAGGGRIVKAAIGGLERQAGGFRLSGNAKEMHCKTLVIAAGAWSAPLAAGLGARVPLDTERGYHITVAGCETGFDRPVASEERKVIATPMRMGVRMTGFVELAGLRRPPDPRKFEILRRHFRALVGPFDEARLSEWMGFRPSLPDFLPVIGPAPNAPGAYLAFGHQHIGLTLSAVTGEIIADLVAGREGGIDLAPFRADRFGPA